MSTTAVALRFRVKDILDEMRDAGTPLSQSELARRAGLSLSIVDAIVHNRQGQVRLTTLEALSVALDVSVGDLFEREDG